ncbi:MAG: hypothetical protein U0414_26285 [Polyangiaceae bacterium]
MRSKRGLALLGTAWLACAQPAAAFQELGLNAHQSTDVGLDVTRDAGLRWVRIDFNWLDAEKAQGAPDFSFFDGLVDAARSRGLEVLATLGYGPPWASSGDAKGDGTLNDVPLEGAYASFVSAAVTHFKDRVTHYELWNEPNLGQFFEGTVDDYLARVLVPGADAVHAACPSCSVVGPAIATIGDGYDAFFDRVLEQASPKIDVLSGHIYAGFPDLGAGGVNGDDFFNKLEAHRVVKVGDAVVFEGPRSFREIMLARGATQPFWMTETGREAALGDDAALSGQATFDRHVLEAMLPRPWWTVTLFYEAFDEPGSGYAWGVTEHQGSGYAKKPAFDVLASARAKQTRFGGTAADCADGLDEDGDGLIDFPADPDCDSALDADEGVLGATATTGAGGAGGTGGSPSTGGAGGVPNAAAGCACAIDSTASASTVASSLLSVALVGFTGMLRRLAAVRSPSRR